MYCVRSPSPSIEVTTLLHLLQALQQEAADQSHDDERRRDKQELRQEERAADQRREDARHYAAQEQHNDQHLKDHREAIEREAHLELGSKSEGVEARFASSSHCHPPLAARSPASSRISPLIRFHPFPATQASPFTNGTRSL